MKPPRMMVWGGSVYLDAFWSLSADRNSGMTAGRIPFTAIDRYAERHGFEDFDLLEYLIREMDSEFLAPGKTQDPGVQTQPINATLFDSMF